MAPVNPLNEKKTMIIAFIAAAAVFMVLVAGLSYLRDTIKNPKDVTSKLDTRLLGSIYHEKKSKSIKLRKKKEFVSMLISNPLRSFQYAESNKMMSSRVRSYMDKENAKTLLVTSVMENEGKSTVAVQVMQQSSSCLRSQ